jgi:hypothetical protein
LFFSESLWQIMISMCYPYFLVFSASLWLRGRIDVDV